MGELDARTKSWWPHEVQLPDRAEPEIRPSDASGSGGRGSRAARAARAAGQQPFLVLAHSVSCHFQARSTGGKLRWAMCVCTVVCTYFVFPQVHPYSCTPYPGSCALPCPASPFPAHLLGPSRLSARSSGRLPHTLAPSEYQPRPRPSQSVSQSHSHSHSRAPCTPAHMHPLPPPACHASRSASDV